MKIYRCCYDLPRDNEYVVGRIHDFSWQDEHTKYQHKWKVVKFIRGISKIDRDKLADSNPRKKKIYISDEHLNNEKPYCWDTSGPELYNGQDVDIWFRLPSEMEVINEASPLPKKYRGWQIYTYFMDDYMAIKAISIDGNKIIKYSDEYKPPSYVESMRNVLYKKVIDKIDEEMGEEIK